MVSTRTTGLFCLWLCDIQGTRVEATKPPHPLGYDSLISERGCRPSAFSDENECVMLEMVCVQHLSLRVNAHIMIFSASTQLSLCLFASCGHGFGRWCKHVSTRPLTLVGRFVQSLFKGRYKEREGEVHDVAFGTLDVPEREREREREVIISLSTRHFESVSLGSSASQLNGVTRLYVVFDWLTTANQEPFS